MKILLVEPFFSGSHRQWAEGYAKHSRHRIELLTLPGRHWKWRMFGGAVSLARQFLVLPESPDLILASDMLDLGTFLGLTKKKSTGIPSLLYFHENQITYPWSPSDPDQQLGRNHQYGYINFTSALAADGLCFNSCFHRQAFLESLPAFLEKFPDFQEIDLVESLAKKAAILPLGLDLRALTTERTLPKPQNAVLLWNHRWEYDKAPETFFELLFWLKDEGWPFHLIVMGEQYTQVPAIFKTARKQLSDRIVHWGYAKNRQQYIDHLQLADVLPVTSRQEFFGASAVEAIYSNCYPLLPNRLSYPEHIPADLHHRHLYQTETELREKLKEAIKNIHDIRNGQFRHFVDQYDWSILADQYDQYFEKFNT